MDPKARVVEYTPEQFFFGVDIDLGKKALWLATFVLTLGFVAIGYGFVELSRSSLMAGEPPEPRGS